MLSAMLEAARRRAAEIDVAAVRRAADRMPGTRSLEEALSRPGMSVIAEIKRRSPSRGALAAALDPVRQAERYAAGGAAAVSVLTDPDFFDGSLDDLTEVRLTTSVPVLRKDFIVHPVQVWESRAAGADALLLIVAALDDATLTALLSETAEAGMEALVEVHTVDEVRRAEAAGARIVGVNNRDLTTFRVDLAVAEALGPELGGFSAKVAESGIGGAADARRMAAAGYDAVLVGESLVTADDPSRLLAEMTGVEP